MTVGADALTRVSDNANGDGEFLKRPRHTDSTGSVRVSYKKTGGPEIQNLVAVHDLDTGFCDVDHEDYANREGGPDEDTSTTEDNCTTGEAATSDDIVTPFGSQATVHWYVRGTVAASTAKNVLDGSSADGEVVVDGADADAGGTEEVTTGQPVLLTFDDNDIFRVGRDGDDANDTVDDAELRYVTLGDFEEALDAVLDPDGDEGGTLQWSGYDDEDSDERTLFILRITDDA